MLREVFVQKGVVSIQDVQDRAVALEDVGEETNRLLIHRAAQAGEGREMPLALLAQLVEVVDVQPGAGELGGEPAGACIPGPATRLGGEQVGVAGVSPGG